MKFITVFLVYGMIFIPFPFTFFRFRAQLSNFLFGPIVKYLGHAFFNYNNAGEISSDSVGMYLLVLFLLVLALATLLVLKAIIPDKEQWDRLIYITRLVGQCYLALILFKYGIDKVFRNQFYVPEPNTLFTPIGDVEKDLLFWSAMGTSYFYSFFLGILEIGTSFLILFKRTRLAGLILSLGIMLNVIAINFGFDISVKLYSLFLFVLISYLLFPDYQRLGRFFFPAIDRSNEASRRSFSLLFIKWFLVLLFLAEGLYPFFRRNNANSSMITSRFIPGAFEVRQVIRDMDTLPIYDSPIHRIFFHKAGYLIFQDWFDKMKDYRVTVDRENQYLILTDYNRDQTILPFQYEKKDSSLSFNYSVEGRSYRFVAKPVDWKKKALLRKGFHWFADSDQ